MKRLALSAIRVYQLALSPYVGGQCRHAPSCSGYAYGAVSKYGAAGGAWLAAKRLARCHPWGASGYDPVP